MTLRKIDALYSSWPEPLRPGNVRDILNNGGDLFKRVAVEPEWVAQQHDNLRGAAFSDKPDWIRRANNYAPPL